MRVLSHNKKDELVHNLFNDGCDFERVKAEMLDGEINWGIKYAAQCLTAPHNADRAADKQRIAELESALNRAMQWLDDDVPLYIVTELKTIRGEL